MISNSPEAVIARQYFAQANGPIAFLLISLGYTSLQLPHPKPFAVFVLVFSLLWLYSVGGAYRRALMHFLPKGAPFSRYLEIVFSLFPFLISFCFVAAVAAGVELSDIYLLLGYEVEASR